jgi:hypothetical protein
MAQNMATRLATSLLNFQLKKMFKNMVCILGLFGLATVLATLKKTLGNFFPNHLVTLVRRGNVSMISGCNIVIIFLKNVIFGNCSLAVLNSTDSAQKVFKKNLTEIVSFQEQDS